MELCTFSGFRGFADGRCGCVGIIRRNAEHPQELDKDDLGGLRWKVGGGGLSLRSLGTN